MPSSCVPSLCNASHAPRSIHHSVVGTWLISSLPSVTSFFATMTTRKTSSSEDCPSCCDASSILIATWIRTKLRERRISTTTSFSGLSSSHSPNATASNACVLRWTCFPHSSPVPSARTSFVHRWREIPAPAAKHWTTICNRSRRNTNCASSLPSSCPTIDPAIAKRGCATARGRSSARSGFAPRQRVWKRSCSVPSTQMT
mmetsp:Transcript_12104/g.35092  ORF Transcript_12104/g.35092 Transcript_12104/m.35092 type:complete len:201 (-) Transcript_12104:254-856(-)